MPHPESVWQPAGPATTIGRAWSPLAAEKGGKLIQFGGGSGDQLAYDAAMYRYAGAGWTSIVQAGAWPAARSAHNLVYDANQLVKSESALIVYSLLNPLVPVIEGLRQTIFYGEAPQWWPLLASGCSSLVFLLGGIWMFKRLETGIADIA